jgi:FtsZ-interacting cell division protein ZipA
MTWLIIIIGIILLITIINVAGSSKRKEQDRLEFSKIFEKGREQERRKREISKTLLSDKDEIVAQRLNKLLFSISYHEFKQNTLAYENASREMKEIGDKIEADGGRDRWLQIKSRVEILCGEHFVGFSKYLYLTENSIS